ncbi:MAG: hypothetical protein QOD03_329 [Verrucomicrobiota bacterium]|jgi:hypothetical protein
MRNYFLLAALFLSTSLFAAEKTFDFSNTPLDQTPKGFRSTVAGKGKSGAWKVILDDVPPILAPLTANAPIVAKRTVLAQLSREPVDERFPMLIYEDETFGDFKLTTRFKTVGGAIEQMAGIAFRIQNETNYYVLRASSLGNTFRFYKVVNGERGALIGPEVQIPKDVWHEMTIECRGNQIHCLLNGKEIIPMLSDNTFTGGKIGFWTKSDSVSYFVDTKITYTPREILAQTLVSSALKKYPRVLGIKLFAVREPGKAPVIIASNDAHDIGDAGGKVEQDVITQGRSYFGKSKEVATVTIPLRDRNGETIAAARLIMRSFLGETEDAALMRAQPIMKEMQSGVQSLEDLLQ